MQRPATGKKAAVGSLGVGLALVLTVACDGLDPRSPFGSEHSVEGSVVSPESAARRRIELEEPTILEQAGVPWSFEMRPALAAGADKTLYVLDPGTLKILAIDDIGHEKARFAGRGLGLGRLMTPGSLAVIGDHVVVSNYDSALIKIWDLAGNFVDEVLPEQRAKTIQIAGYDRSSLLRTYRVPGDPSRMSVARLWLDGREEELFTIQLPDFPTGDVMGRATLLYDLAQYPRLAHGQSGTAYLNGGSGYEVAAFDPERGGSWVLRAPWQPLPYSKERAAVFLQRVQALEEAFRPRFSPPTHFPTLSAVRTDGLGRLYVFPFTRVDGHEFPHDYPVDVYSRSGQLLVHGILEIGGRSWLAAVDDIVFGVVRSSDSGAYQILRARIALP